MGDKKNKGCGICDQTGRLYADAVSHSHEVLQEGEGMELQLEFTKRYMEISDKVSSDAINMIIKGLAILGADAAMVNHFMIDLANEITAVEDLADEAGEAE